MPPSKDKPITFFKRNPYPDAKRQQMVYPLIHIAMALQTDTGFGTFHAICGYSYSMHKCSFSKAKKAASKRYVCKKCIKAQAKESQ